ncbi:MAG: D-alanine--D-alanine ligase family protein [Rhodoglobus sp.]
MTRLRVAVIGGGQNPEHTVSLASAASVAGALTPHRYDVVALTIDRDGEWRDAAGLARGVGEAMRILSTCDVVIPLVHGRRGEDGTLAALCEIVDVAYVGSGVEAGAIGMNKYMAKVLAESLGIRTASAVMINRDSADDYAYRGPVIVKPNSGGSSVGVALATNATEFRRAVDDALAMDDRVLVEEIMVGREIDIAVITLADGSVLVSPPLEIEVDGLFDEQSKYGGDAIFHIPAALDSVTRTSLEQSAERLYDAMGCSGVARFDFFLTADGLVLNEVNTTPGFTAQSQVPRMFESIGVRYEDLLDLLISDALASQARPALQKTGQ